MFENYNETELLSLMLNKDEFILYITQQCNNNVCCTPLEPIIWAVHFNIPKFQRLPLLENILLRSMAYIKKCYSFLPDKQILGKTYEVLGIPTVCGEPNKCFLNAYKKYKPYYPVRYPKNKKTPLLCNVVHNSIEINPGIKYSKMNSIESSLDLEIVCSTPNNKNVHIFEVHPLLSPIKSQINEEIQIWPTDSFYDRINVLNIQNITQNNIVSDNKQIVALPRTLEQSGLDILNTSQQILSNAENGDISKINHSNNTQSEIHFISRDPKYFSYDNDISESNMSSLSNECTQESYNKKENEYSNRNTNSVYFEDSLKKIEYKVSDLKKSSVLIKKKKTSVVLKQSLSEKIKKNSSLLQNNSWLRKSIASPPVNTKTSNLKKIKYNTQKSTLESSAEVNKTYDISFSDFDETSQTQKLTMKPNQAKNMHHNPTEHDSIRAEYSDTQNSWNIESQNNNREVDSISSVNSSLEVYNKHNYSENQKMYKPSTSNLSLLTFRDTSVLNSTISSDSNVYKENNTKPNYRNVIHNITLSEETWTLQENITMNFSSENNTLLSSKTNTLAYISNFEENSE